MQQIRRPLIRYHGGKWQLSPWIISHFPVHRVYVEPFGGAGSVLLKKKRSEVEIYNDMDDEMVNLFRVTRDKGDELRQALELTPFARAEFDLSWEATGDQFERARRTVVRACMGRDSASATCAKKSSFRLYVGDKRTSTTQDWINYPVALGSIIARLRGVGIENYDAKKVMLKYDGAQTLHYADPPYVFSTRGDSGRDYRHEMCNSDHEDLLLFLSKLSGMVVLSGYDSELYQDTLRGWQKFSRKSFADGANERNEILWVSPNCVPDKRAQFLLSEAA